MELGGALQRFLLGLKVGRVELVVLILVLLGGGGVLRMARAEGLLRANHALAAAGIGGGELHLLGREQFGASRLQVSAPE